MNITEKSLNQKILNFAKSSDVRDVNKIRTTIALERLVARIMSSDLLERKLVFCGGFVLYKEGFSERHTRDVDMISSEKDHDEVIEEIKKMIKKDLGDGFWFGDTKIESIQDTVLYGGFRFRPLYKVGTPHPPEVDTSKLRRVHLDLSFQAIEPDMSSGSVMNTSLEGFEKVSWNIYPIEFTAADKIHAIISRGGLSTRSKDVYDLSLILKKCNKMKLRSSLSYTFSTRNISLDQPVFIKLRNIDTLSLENNWSKLELGDMDFENCWQEVIRYFESF